MASLVGLYVGQYLQHFRHGLVIVEDGVCGIAGCTSCGLGVGAQECDLLCYSYHGERRVSAFCKSCVTTFRTRLKHVRITDVTCTNPSAVGMVDLICQLLLPQADGIAVCVHCTGRTWSSTVCWSCATFEWFVPLRHVLWNHVRS